MTSGVMTMTKPVLVYCTVPDRENAAVIGKKLVETRLAACVSFGSSPIESIYRWEGNVEAATEYVLTIKTIAENYQAIEELIISLHPYDVPEIISVGIDNGLKLYLDWMKAETKLSV